MDKKAIDDAASYNSLNKANRIRLSLWEKISYALSGGGFCVCFMTIGGYLLFVYTDIFHLNPVTAANIFLFTRFWDAINDPIMGAIVDKRLFYRSGKGVYRPWIFLAIPCVFLTFAACFTMPSFITTEFGKTAWAVIMYVLYTMAQTLGQVPYGSLSNAMTTNTEERGSLGAFRNFGENIAGLIVSMFIMGLVAYFGKNGAEPEAGWSGAAITLGVIAALMLLIGTRSIKERTVTESHESASFAESFKALMKNRPVICLAIGLFVAAVIINFKFAFNMYYLQYYLEGSAGMITTVNSVQTAVSIIAFIPVNYMFSKLEKKQMLMLTGVLFALDGVLFLVAGKNFPMIIAASVLFGFLMCLSFSTVWGTIPDGVEYGLWKTGVCTPAFLFAIVTFAQKCGIGIASWLAGMSLNSVGYVAGAALSEATKQGLFYWNGGVLIIGGILFLLVTLPYNLTKELYCRILVELDSKR